MNIFRNSNQNKTAKEYIERKRNFNLFYDLSNNPMKNKITCIKGNKITKVINHSNLINLTKGYFDYYQSNKCVSANADLSSNYDIEKFSKNKLAIIKNRNEYNTDISNSYTGNILINGRTPELITDTITDSTTDKIKNYGEYVSEDNSALNGSKFTYNKKIKYVNCIKMHTNGFKEM
mgnify:CR=1 FL=1|tara:strand:- start:227 stop:757 length:531 start_codon:yes stop_codon:yes gene_type:complete